MKKALKLMVGALATSLMLTACGNGAEEGSVETETDAEVKLTAWAWNINVPVIESAAEKFKEENPGFELEVVEMGRLDVYSRLTTGLQAGGQGLPDIVLMEDDRIQGYLNSFPDAFVNVSELGFDAHTDKLPSYKLDLLTKDGDVYGFPFDGGPTGVFYRTDYFEQAGVDAEAIETWDEMIEAGKKVQDEVGVSFIGLDLHGDDDFYRMMLNQQGTFYFNENGEINVDSEESIRAMNVTKSLYDEGLVRNTVGWDAWVGSLVEGNTAIAPSGAWLYGSITQQGPDTAGNWGVIQLPAFEEGENRASNLGGSNYLIPTATDHEEAAYEFMEFFATTDEVQLQAMEGGLFPTLNTIYDHELFTQEDEFFNNQAIWKLFADEMDDIPAVNYTGNYAVARDESIKAQSEIVNGRDVEDALEQAKRQLENRITN
ncbi:ABC transporter substrate-binding protein [Alkalihalophilus sp. As8PL]|uniref:ABC transporter substrate-binding protein n=1 Tax=Alkalihalophilus sp. As8PL TaxID=3237103 RepID=A0AB39BXN5_9BACI